MVELVKVIYPQVLEMTFALKQVVAHHEQRMTDGDDGSLLSSVGSHALKVGGEVARFAARGTPSALAKLLPQPSAPFSCLAAETLAGAFVVSRTNSSPRSQVVSRRKLVHVHSDFGDHTPRRSPVKTGDLG